MGCMRRILAATLGTMAEDWVRYRLGALIPWALYATLGLFMVLVVVGTVVAVLVLLFG